MNIIKVEPVSLVDWPGQIASVIHVKGCNFNCNWCFNKDIVSFDMNGVISIGFKGVMALIPEKIDHIIITGGEPFAQHGIVEFIHKLKDEGYKVGIHTNGSFPDELAVTIYSLDYVAIDIKGYVNMYPERGFSSVASMLDVMDCLYVITDSPTPHEFRTTMFPGVTKNEVYSIANMLRHLNADAYYLQPYIPVNGEKPKEYMSRDRINKIARKISKEFNAKGFKTIVIARG